MEITSFSHIVSIKVKYILEGKERSVVVHADYNEGDVFFDMDLFPSVEIANDFRQKLIDMLIDNIQTSMRPIEEPNFSEEVMEQISEIYEEDLENIYEEEDT